MTREELQKTYSKLSTNDLLDILDNKFNYTELAVAKVFEELAKREITEQHIKDYKNQQIDLAEEFIQKNIEDDLVWYQKVLFFFIWIPLITFALKQNLSDDGYLLKLKQANYFSLLGFLFLALAVFVSIYLEMPESMTIMFWLIGFVITYIFDDFFNRRQQIEKVKKILPKNETDKI